MWVYVGQTYNSDPLSIETTQWKIREEMFVCIVSISLEGVNYRSQGFSTQCIFKSKWTLATETEITIRQEPVAQLGSAHLRLWVSVFTICKRDWDSTHVKVQQVYELCREIIEFRLVAQMVCPFSPPTLSPYLFALVMDNYTTKSMIKVIGLFIFPNDKLIVFYSRCVSN